MYDIHDSNELVVSLMPSKNLATDNSEIDIYFQFKDKLQNMDELHLGGNDSELLGDCIIHVMRHPVIAITAYA